MCKLFIWKGKNIWSHIFLILHWHFVRVFIGMVVRDSITGWYYCVLFPFVCCFTPPPLPPPPPPPLTHPPHPYNTAKQAVYILTMTGMQVCLLALHSTKEVAGRCVRLAWFPCRNVTVCLPCSCAPALIMRRTCCSWHQCSFRGSVGGDLHPLRYSVCVCVCRVSSVEQLDPLSWGHWRL